VTTARILIIAGSDSGGGAGIQADIKTVTMLGAHAMTAITAVTAQNTLGVTAVHALPAEMVLAQIDAVTVDIGVDAVKIGMIGSPAILEAVADRLDRPDLAALPVVFDPVMIATSGSRLADAVTIAAFGRLLRRATVSTPNLNELAVLSGAAVESAEEARSAATTLLEAGAGAILATGGAYRTGVLTDVLVSPDGVEQWESSLIDTVHDHGTGCSLASAIATGLGQGMDLGAAIARARAFVRAALENAPGLGSGHGPMGHYAAGLTPSDVMIAPPHPLARGSGFSS